MNVGCKCVRDVYPVIVVDPGSHYDSYFGLICFSQPKHSHETEIVNDIGL